MGKRLAVIGSPLGHTLSPAIHGAAIGMLGLDLTYEAMEIPLGVAGERLPEFFQGLRGADWLGCNVTVPYKQIVLAYLDERTDEVQAIGATNTVVNHNGRLIGHNTDAVGFLVDVQEHFGPVDGKTVLLLGAGGAARAM